METEGLKQAALERAASWVEGLDAGALRMIVVSKAKSRVVQIVTGKKKKRVKQ